MFCQTPPRTETRMNFALCGWPLVPEIYRSHSMKSQWSTAKKFQQDTSGTPAEICSKTGGSNSWVLLCTRETLLACFGPKIAASGSHRNFRFKNMLFFCVFMKFWQKAGVFWCSIAHEERLFLFYNCFHNNFTVLVSQHNPIFAMFDFFKLALFRTVLKCGSRVV